MAQVADGRKHAARWWRDTPGVNETRSRKLYCPSCPAQFSGARRDVVFILEETPAGHRVHTRCRFHANEIKGQVFTQDEWEERRQRMLEEKRVEQAAKRVMAALVFRAEPTREWIRGIGETDAAFRKRVRRGSKKP